MPTLELSNPAALPADWRDFVALTKPRVKVFFSTKSGMPLQPRILDLASSSVTDRIAAREPMGRIFVMEMRAEIARAQIAECIGTDPPKQDR